MFAQRVGVAVVRQVYDSIGCEVFAHVYWLLAGLVHGNARTQDLHERLQLELSSPLVRRHHALAVGLKLVAAMVFGSRRGQRLQISKWLELRAVRP